MKKSIKYKILFSLFFGLCVLYFSGPGWAYLYTPAVNEVQLDLSVDEYVRRRESQVKNIKADNQAHILWSGSDHTKSEYSLVYLHGFSASPREISPVIETLSRNFKMNSYFQRFYAHGLTNGLMEDLTADQLFQDAEEAYAIGNSIGKKVILIGTSTGASLAIWLASRYTDVAGLVLISPNLGIRDPKGVLAPGPLGYWIARVIVGPYHEWKPQHPRQDSFWTSRYSVAGIRAMSDVIREVEVLKMNSIQPPTLVLWTAQDKVVNIQKALSILKNMGSEKKQFVEIHTPEHVLAGDIKSPQTTPRVIEIISQFLQKL